MDTITKKIYLIRHGETDYNKLGLIQGSGVDTDLNTLGKLQAQAFYEAYKNVGFDKVYTSALKRTHQTVAPFLAEGVSWQQLSGLNEICWGTKEGKAAASQDNEQHEKMLAAWKKGDFSIKPPQGESPLDVMERQKAALAAIMAATTETNVLVCMHGRAMKIFLCLLLEVELKNMDIFKHENVCLYILHYRNGSFELELANDTEHLQTLKELNIDRHTEELMLEISR